VSRLEPSWVFVAAAALANAGTVLAQGEDISNTTDLTAVIALQGKPCGKVVNATKRGEDDYLATCENGNRYRVYVKDGRVVVEQAG
jgi:hypothetical protein